MLEIIAVKRVFPKEIILASEKVVRSYLWIAGLYTLSASLIWGVNTLFLLDAGLSIFQVFIANSVFTGAMSLFEIPTGVLADTSGRRISFLLSVAVLAVGTLGYVGVAQYGGGLAWFCIMSVVLGLGYTFYSGAVEAWLVDALKATNYDGQLEHVFSRGGMVTGAMMLVGTVGGGLLGDIDLAVPFFVRAVLLSLLFVLAFFNMRDIGYEPRALKLARIPAEMKILAQASLKYGWNKPELRMLMLAGLIQFGFSAWGFYAWQPYFLELLGRDAVWVAGVVAALIAVAMMTGNALVSWLTRFCGKRTTLLLWAAGTFSAASVGVGLTGSFWVAVGLFVLSMLASGISTPVRQAYIHEVIPSDQRATIISLDSMVVSGGSILGQSGLGYLSQVGSIASGYVWGGLSTVTALPFIWMLRRMGEPADNIAGKAGKESACAAQGLPEVSGVNAAAGQGLVD